MSHFYDAAGWTGFRLKIKDGPHIVPVFRHSLHGLLFHSGRLSISSHAPAGTMAAPAGVGALLGGGADGTGCIAGGFAEKGASDGPASLSPKLPDL